MRSSHFKWPLLEVQGMYSIEVESVSKKIFHSEKEGQQIEELERCFIL